MFSIEDLQKIILYIVDTTNIEGQIYDASHAAAETVRVKHTTKLNNFLEWYTERPAYLKHILQHIDEIHNDIQEKVDKLSLAVSYFKKQEEYYNIIDTNFMLVKNQYHKSKQLCSICGDSEKRKCLLNSFVAELNG